MKASVKLNWPFLLGITLVSAMGGLLFGYDWVVIGGAKPFYEPFFGISENPAMQGWAMSCALLGCLAGAVLSGWLSDRFGRKRLLILSAFLFIAASLGTGMADNFNSFIAFRILGGIGIGLASNLSPMYIAEITPSSVRGAFVSINQLTIVTGILAAQLINWQIAQPVAPDASASDILNSWNGQTGWRWMFYACAVPSILFFILMWFIPESPRWLAKNSDNHKRVFRILGKVGGSTYAEQELSAIVATLDVKTENPIQTILRQKGIVKLLVIGIVIAVFQQWCGINVIFNYAQEIFSNAGYGVSDIMFNIVITGSVNLVFTLVGMFTVDKLGRKALMLLGAGGLALNFLTLGTMYFLELKGLPMLIMVVLAVATYGMSLAPVTWVILSEIFPNRIRGFAMSVATFSLWTACFVLTYTFPLLNHSLKASGTFWLYGVICVLGFLFIKRKLPETKGKSLEEIEHELIK
ncbi:MAG: sugar porter family MFS transporter [Bacteroidales bacterium]|nr:sugar porter family MFS transporter [Bacteroidales bacterium]HQJ83573.1 sugar porter family MFS transporter [Bacteroidales bacterium]